MGRIFPDEMREFATAGEEKVYHFLRKAVIPHDRFFAWYSPDIEDREPDFILLSPDCGLIVLEVKDWILEQILELDPKHATLQIGERQERRKQPLAQARQYVNNLLSLFSKHALPGQENGLPCPVTWGAVLPHIPRKDWLACKLNKVLDERRIIFWEELQSDSSLCRDISGGTFRKWLLEHFPPQFRFELTPDKINYIRDLVFPIVRINLPLRASIDSSAQAKTVIALDHDQENLARNYGTGRLLISGPAGSGKTLLLATRAWHLMRINNKIKRVLFTCFNLSLAGYIRRLVARRGACIGSGGVEIIPFYKLCERIIGEKLDHINEGPDYYELVINECLERLACNNPFRGSWDAIMVDEGQDFSLAMAKVVTALLPDSGILTIAQDGNQRLYQKKAASWPEMGIPGLTVRTLERQYRNTKQIASYAGKFLGIADCELVGAEGEKPEMLYTQNAEGQIEVIADSVLKLVKESQPMSEIAVLYFSSRLGSVGNFPEAMIAALEARGILGRWLTRDISSKSFYDITTDSVTVSTVHSVKGMDFANVFLAGFEKVEPGNDYLRHLAYVGMTRARERLFICQTRR